MQATLISYTMPVPRLIEKGINNPEELVVYTARVSNPANQFNTMTSPKLFKYLMEHKHWSPMDMVDVTIEVQTTRDIGRQIIRHWSFDFQEFSQRYALADMDFEFREARLQDNKNRQNSLETADEVLAREWLEAQQSVANLAKEKYEWAVSKGIAKEQARALLPEGLTKTTMYMKGSLRSWIFYLQLRTDVATQKEHRMVALACFNEMKPILPNFSKYVKIVEA